MKYLMFLALLSLLTLCEFFIYSGQAGWAYPCAIGAIGAGILMINAVVEDRLKKAMADRVIK